MDEQSIAAYRQVLADTGGALIPSGDAIRCLRKNVTEFDYPNGGLSLHRDGFHLSLNHGRYAALTWSPF